jgi:hypothetical protein
LFSIMKQSRRDLSFLLQPKILDENYKVAFFYYAWKQSIMIIYVWLASVVRLFVLAAALGSPAFEVCFGQSSVADVIDGMSQ